MSKLMILLTYDKASVVQTLEIQWMNIRQTNIIALSTG